MNHPSHETFAAFAASSHHAELERDAVRREILAEREAAAKADLEQEVTHRINERRGVPADTDQESAVA
jgi:hypothetical protein